ncbi:hypothetical protein [Streptomyces edwardsiae]|uniref:Uncharacterized protein n=1 Tax=Streptomyces edwardsiae TaxID=3075527 RepID=A0ABU2PSF6_9ACTN|nr:hypothetical protein [Streptomyces sp. DSM 41636]MDT0393690.1 hypothetical protein [Streptomyces sp. DSM 41636]
MIGTGEQEVCPLTESDGGLPLLAGPIAIARTRAGPRSALSAAV